MFWSALLVALVVSILPFGSVSACPANTAEITLTHTIATSKLAPSMALTFVVDKASATPGATLGYTASVSNTGATLALTGTFKAVSTSTTRGTLKYWSEWVEYYDSARSIWLPLVGAAGTAAG